MKCKDVLLTDLQKVSSHIACYYSEVCFIRKIFRYEHEILFNFLPIWVQDTTKGFTNKVYDGTTEPEIYRDNSISYYHKALNKTSGRVQIMTKMSSKVRLV
jgi:hypothetical protein